MGCFEKSNKKYSEKALEIKNENQKKHKPSLKVKSVFESGQDQAFKDGVKRFLKSQDSDGEDIIFYKKILESNLQDDHFFLAGTIASKLF